MFFGVGGEGVLCVTVSCVSSFVRRRVVHVTDRLRDSGKRLRDLATREAFFLQKTAFRLRRRVNDLRVP